jgi:hypothetical protein
MFASSSVMKILFTILVADEQWWAMSMTPLAKLSVFFKGNINPT